MDFDSLVDDSQSQQPSQGQSQAPAQFDDLQDDSENPQPQSGLPHPSGLDTLKAGVLGLERGLTGGLSDVWRKKAEPLFLPSSMQTSPEEINRLQEEHPIASTAGELAGNVATLSALPESELLGSAGWLSKVGSAAVDQGLKQASLEGSKELSKYLDDEMDPNEAVASHIANAGAIGLLTGGLYGAGTSTTSRMLAKANLGKKLSSSIIGFGHGLAYPAEDAVGLSESSIPELERSGIDNGAFKAGQKIASVSHGNAAHRIGQVGSSIAGGIAGHILGHGNAGELTGAVVGPMIENAVEPYVGKLAARFVGKPILKAASKGYINDIGDLADYGVSTAKGQTMLSKGIENLFSMGGAEAVNSSFLDKDRENLRKHIEQNSLDQEIQQAQNNPGYADGGEIQPQSLQLSNGLSQHMPQHNQMLSAAKGRVFNYLKSVRPQKPASKLPFDMHRKNPQEEHEYDKTLDLANKPLTILNDIKRGNLTPQKTKAFVQMYPELHHEMSKKMMENIVDKSHGENRPPHHLRQSLSLFLGTNLDSNLNPANIMAAQNVFAQQRMQKNNAVNPKAGLSKAGKMAQTAEQGREERLNKN